MVQNSGNSTQAIGCKIREMESAFSRMFYYYTVAFVFVFAFFLDYSFFFFWNMPLLFISRNVPLLLTLAAYGRMYVVLFYLFISYLFQLIYSSFSSFSINKQQIKRR
jgi:hypothetical protein